MNTNRSISTVALFVGLALSSSVMAETTATATTAPVKGHAPSYNTAPIIGFTDTNTNGVIDIGDVLTATEGTFADSDGDASAGPTWRWNDGATDLGHGDSYTISAGDLGKTIKLFATPNTNPAVTDPAVGTEVGGGTAGTPGTAAAVSIAAEGDIVSVDITGVDESTGFPMVGADLFAIPTCVGQCFIPNFQWQIEDNIGSGNYVDIKGARSNVYTPVKEDQKRKIQVVVTP